MVKSKERVAVSVDNMWMYLIVIVVGVTFFALFLLLDMLQKRKLKCPHCGQAIKAVGLLGAKKKAECKCGTRVKIAKGRFSYYISDWKPPEGV